MLGARKFLNWESGVTNESGIAVMSGTFSGSYNWSIEWAGGLWTIRDGALFTAIYNGAEGKTVRIGSFLLQVEKTKAYGHVQRACYTCSTVIIWSIQITFSHSEFKWTWNNFPYKDFCIR